MLAIKFIYNYTGGKFVIPNATLSEEKLSVVNIVFLNFGLSFNNFYS